MLVSLFYYGEEPHKINLCFILNFRHKYLIETLVKEVLSGLKLVFILFILLKEFRFDFEFHLKTVK